MEQEGRNRPKLHKQQRRLLDFVNEHLVEMLSVPIGLLDPLLKASPDNLLLQLSLYVIKLLFDFVLDHVLPLLARSLRLAALRLYLLGH